MQARIFNTISIDTEKGIFTKSSLNKTKLRDEIHYYLNLPPKVIDFFPRLLSYSKDYSTYSLEYLPYQTLEEMLLKDKLSLKEGKAILLQLLNILDDMHSFHPDFSYTKEDIYNFYIKKTLSRMNELRKQPLFKTLLSEAFININGKQYKNFLSLKQDFIYLIRNRSEHIDRIKMIHGDFCFSNILYYPSEKKFKLIDPRGSFAHPGIYGHTLYDYAKLMHCLHSGYDYIANDNFILHEYNHTNFYLEIPTSETIKQLEIFFIHELRQKKIDLEYIYLIEASLFLSMTSLHYENMKRQKAMYLKGLILLNQVVEGKYANMY